MRPGTLHHLRDRVLRRARTIDLDEDLKWRAAVAIVLRERDGELEVLIIRRAVREGDFWSGDAALPGGRMSAEDASLEETAAREAREEVGVDLSRPSVERLGRLSEHPRERYRKMARFRVMPVVYAVREDPSLTLDPREVAGMQWVPLRALRSPEHQGRRVFWWRPVRALPVKLPMLMPTWHYEGLTIWGLTHGILTDLLQTLG